MRFFFDTIASVTKGLRNIKDEQTESKGLWGKDSDHHDVERDNLNHSTFPRNNFCVRWTRDAFLDLHF